MLYLHCGMPRTGTTSLQTALFEHDAGLAAADLVFPDMWRSGHGPTHHGLAELLDASLTSAAAFDGFRRFLEAQADRDVLLSAEVLTFWLDTTQRQDALLGLLAAAREAMPVRCVWALRRLDDALHSLYLRRVDIGIPLPSPARFFAGACDPDALFAGMRRVEDAVGGDAVYVRYDTAGAHNRELLDAFGISGEVGEAIRRRLEDGPRRNAGLSRKRAAALLNVEALSARAGADLDAAALRRASWRGELSFEHDGPCELVGDRVRKAAHEGALAAARRQGFPPYPEFFADEEIAARAPDSLGPEVIDDEDLLRLAALPRSPPPGR
jgi:hypothetical protein